MNNPVTQAILSYLNLGEQARSMSDSGLPTTIKVAGDKVLVNIPIAPGGGVTFATPDQARIFLLGVKLGREASTPRPDADRDQGHFDAVTAAMEQVQRELQRETGRAEKAESPDIVVKAYALDPDSPVAEAVSSLLAAVVDPSASKGDRLRAAGEVLNAVNSL